MPTLKKNKKEDFPKSEDEDEQKISKKMKKDGKAEFTVDKPKERRHYAGSRKNSGPHKSKKVYDRKKEKNLFESEDVKISKMVEAIIEKNPAEANKYLKDVVNSKIKTRISKEIEKPLF